MACNLTTGEVEYIDKNIADLKTENDQLVMKLNAEHLVRQNVERENAKLREYVTELERANLDVTARLADYIGQYDPTDAFVAEVKAENAKLLDQKADAYNDMVNAQLDADALQAENAELRELVRTFYHCTTSGECDECPINGGGPVHLMPDTICDTIHDRMRELGVEV